MPVAENSRRSQCCQSLPTKLAACSGPKMWRVLQVFQWRRSRSGEVSAEGSLCKAEPQLRAV